MAEGEEPLGSDDVSTAGVTVPESEATDGAMTEEVGPGESLLSLQNLWYYSSPLFPEIGASEVSPPGVPKKWILKERASDVAAREIATEVLGQEHASKDLEVTVTTREATAEPRVESFGAATRGMSLEEFLERFVEDEENEKVATDFHPFSSDTVMFQRSEMLAEVLLDMQRTRLESSNLQKVLEWKNSLKDLLFMKFGVQFILDKIRATAEICIVQDDEFSVKIVDLEKEIAAKRAELSLLLSQRDEVMRSLSAGGAFPSTETFGDGLFD
nr:hypothetical protein CFP56_56768 [Quercus suber]